MNDLEQRCIENWNARAAFVRSLVGDRFPPSEEEAYIEKIMSCDNGKVFYTVNFRPIDSAPENTTPRADETQRDATQNDSVEGEGRK